MTTNALGVTVRFYKANGQEVEDVHATLVDERGKVRVIFDSSNLVTDTKMSVNSYESSNSKETHKHIPIYRETVVGPIEYPHFVGNQKYSLKIATKLLSTGERIKGKFLVDDEFKPVYVYNHYDEDDVKDRFHENANLSNKDEVESIDGITRVEVSCPLVKTTEVFGSENKLDDRTPRNVTFTFDEVDDYSGTNNDSKNEEATSAIVSVPYSEAGIYEFDVAGLDNNKAYNVHVYGDFQDGYAITKTLDETMYVIAAPKIMNVESYGLGDDKIDAGELAMSTVANIDMKNGTIGTRFNVVNNKIKFSFSQEDVVYYTAEMDVLAEAVGETTTYNVMQSNLIKAVWDDNLPQQNAERSYNFDVRAEIAYVDGNTTKQSNIVNEEFTTDIIPVSNVYTTNAWFGSANVDGEGDRVVDWSNATTNSGFIGAPDLGIVGYFYKTDFFNNPHQLYSNNAGLYQDLDVASTRFGYKISVNGGEFVPVQNIHQIQPNSSKSHQENYIDVINAAMQSHDQGQYANITPDGVNAGLKGSQQQPIYFRICAIPSELFNEDDVVKISVSIFPEDGETTLPGPTESNDCVVVKKMTQHTMTVGSSSEPKFTGSGANGVLAIPINVGGDADLNFLSATFKSNLSSPNNEVTQKDEDDIDQGVAPDDDDYDNVYDLIVSNPSNRGALDSDAVEYTVTYTIQDPNNQGSISIESEPYKINLKDEPTSDNFSVSNYSYRTFNNEGESGFVFDVLFNDVGDTSIDGINVYFESINDDTNFTNDIPRILVLNVPRTDGDNQSNLIVTLNGVPAEDSDVSSGIMVNDVNGVDSNRWLNYRSGTIHFVPYKHETVESSQGDQNENDNAKDSEIIMNIPVINMPINVVPVGGVIESYSGTQLIWDDDLVDYASAPSVASSHYLIMNNDNVSSDISNIDDKKSYDLALGNTPSSYKLELRTKLVSVDENVYYSKPVVVEFNSVSVDQTGVNLVVKRGSTIETLKVSFSDHTTVPANASNLNVTELALVNVGQTDNKCVSKQNGVQTLLTDAQIDGVIADSSRSIITIDQEVGGWSVKNTYADGATRPKVNLYYYGNNAVAAVSPPAPNGDGLDESNSFNLSQATGLGLYAIFYQNPGAKYFPFFNAYTATTSSGTNKSWYKSKVFYYPADDHVKADTTDSDNVGLTLVYTGNDDGLLFPEITRRVKYVVRVGSNLTNANDGYENEPVWLLSLQTSGAATSSSESYNFRLLETGMFTSHNSFGQLSLKYNDIDFFINDPESAKVTVLDYPGLGDDVQPHTVTNTYSLAEDFEIGDLLKLTKPRIKAGVDYTEKRGENPYAEKESHSTYLSLVDGGILYRCSAKPTITINPSSSSSNTISLKIDARGQHNEGLIDFVVSLIKEIDHTDENADSESTEMVLSFQSPDGNVGYTNDGNVADATSGTLDNIGPHETVLLQVNDVEGYSERVGTFTLSTGDLTGNDVSVLTLPNDFDYEDLFVVAVAQTHRGTALNSRLLS